jgi:hypothetical protein
METQLSSYQTAEIRRSHVEAFFLQDLEGRLAIHRTDGQFPGANTSHGKHVSAAEDLYY